MKKLASVFGVVSVFIASPAFAICGDGNLEVAEECDDGNLANGDGCSMSCAVETGFVCEAVSFALDVTESLNVSGTSANFIVDSPTRVRQTANSIPAVYGTTMPADIAEVLFTMEVATAFDDDFLGWSIGWDSGELATSGTPATTDWLYFSWKQGTQSAFGGSRQSGLFLSRVTGDANEGQMWSGDGGNVTLLAEANNYPGAAGTASGWADFLKYRVRMVYTPNRIRVWIAPETAVGSGVFGAETLEFDVTPAGLGTPTFPPGNLGFYVHSQPTEIYELLGPTVGSICSVDTDLDGVKDRSDADSDRDGIPDLVELMGFMDDPDVDTDLDGVPDWDDPDNVPGGCVPDAMVPPTCSVLPAAIDPDGDGVPNHLDLDSDGDGITDALETGATDTDGDGVPDDCTTVDPSGTCDSGGLAGAPPNTDAMDTPDFLDLDSDQDGIADLDEAYDGDGDGSGEVTPSSSDQDGDGIDDAFDPDCIAAGNPAGCAVGGTPITALGAAEDSDGDGAPDWIQVCRDGYLTGAEVCDDGNLVDSDACTNLCLFGINVPCTGSGQCGTGICDPADMVCAVCTNDMAGAAVDTGCSAPAPVCDDSLVPNACVVCANTAAPGAVDDGCAVASPACDTSGAVPVCVTCLVDVDCGGAGVCVANSCVACEDDMTGAMLDRGCAAGAPLCDDTGVPVCQSCFDDTTGATDIGCAAAAPVCDVSGGANTCISCEDSATGTMVDNGCDAATPVCDEGGIATCVECNIDSHCGVGTVCGPANTCVPGCTDDSDCVATPDTSVCNVPARVCVECLDDSTCSGTQTCAPTNSCVFADSDLDGIFDDVDLDDDNDGIPDIDELGGMDLSVDTDGDGVQDFQDPDVVTCDDVGGDGICDSVPSSVDFDGDGIPNHLDLDADGDGIADLREGGGDDTDGDGRVDAFDDVNGDGLDDGLAAAPLPLTDTDGADGADFLDIDSDGDGITDTFEAGGLDVDGDGAPDGGSDTNFDGIADTLIGAGALPLTDTNADGTPDYRSVDADGDGVPDVVEGHAGTEPAGADTDGDGLDDAFDPDCADCGGVVGVIAALPDTDSDTRLNFRDVDADGDGISDGIECPMGMMCFDADMDGTPDFLSLDADDDGIPDLTEGHDADSDGDADVVAADADTDGDGLDDAFDPDCVDAADCAGVIGVLAPVADLDGDMRPNFQDSDDDEDGRSTRQELQDAVDYVGPAADPTDVDENDTPNWYDTDSDGDGVSDMAENQGDGDNDDNGILDYLDPNYAPSDRDGDGILDIEECDGVFPPDDSCRDTDDDGVPDYLDVDDDNDGVLTLVEFAAPDPDDGDPENDHDADNDGVPNHLDLDADGDGIPDLWENGGASLDLDGDGSVDTGADADGDGLLAAFDDDDTDPAVTTTGEPVDTDGVGQPDYLDLDADGDGLPDIVESGGTDSDSDGRLDSDTDTDGDGLADLVDPTDGGTPRMPADTDGDGTPNYQDLDSDGDGVPDLTELNDADANGAGELVPLGSDLDGDGIDDTFDTTMGGTSPAVPDRDEDGIPDYVDDDDDGDGIPSAMEDVDADGDPRNDDSDADGVPDYLDPDDDGDGVLTVFEAPDGMTRDTDMDGTPDHRDDDDDGDGLLTETENADPDGNGNPDDALDGDEDGTPDYLDPTDDRSTDGGYSGGSFCSAGGGNGSIPWTLGLLLMALRRRRDR